MFFSEEKNQKTLTFSVGWTSPALAGKHPPAPTQNHAPQAAFSSTTLLASTWASARAIWLSAS
jgi:hypothetical protein